MTNSSRRHSAGQRTAGNGKSLEARLSDSQQMIEQAVKAKDAGIIRLKKGIETYKRAKAISSQYYEQELADREKCVDGLATVIRKVPPHILRPVLDSVNANVTRLCIKIISACELPNVDGPFSKNDPYCVMRINGKEAARTTVKSNSGKEAIWNEFFKLNNLKITDNISIEVWDKDKVTADDAIGKATIAIREFQGDPGPRTYNLSPKGGKVTFDAQVYDYTPPAAQGFSATSLENVLGLDVGSLVKTVGDNIIVDNNRNRPTLRHTLLQKGINPDEMLPIEDAPHDGRSPPASRPPQVQFQNKPPTGQSAAPGGPMRPNPNPNQQPQQNSQEDFPSGARRHRRSSVFSPPPEDDVNWKPKKFFKPKQDEEMIRRFFSTNILFENLDNDQRQVVLDAFELVKYSEGNVIIKQGEEGDRFYVIKEGWVNIFVAHNTPQGEQNKLVATYGPGAPFGELALLYDAPRAATVKAKSASVELWALDRETFKRIIQRTTTQKRNAYAHFVEGVPLLSSLTWYERLTIADALTPETYNQNTDIIKQGDKGSTFFIIESGEVVVKDSRDPQKTIEVATLGAGNYFGEIALLHDMPRAATVTARSPTVSCLSLDRETFTRLMGPLTELLQRNSTDRLAQLQQVQSTGKAPTPQQQQELQQQQIQRLQEQSNLPPGHQRSPNGQPQPQPGPGQQQGRSPGSNPQQFGNSPQGPQYANPHQAGQPQQQFGNSPQQGQQGRPHQQYTPQQGQQVGQPQYGTPQQGQQGGQPQYGTPQQGQQGGQPQYGTPQQGQQGGQPQYGTPQQGQQGGQPQYGTPQQGQQGGQPQYGTPQQGQQGGQPQYGTPQQGQAGQQFGSSPQNQQQGRPQQYGTPQQGGQQQQQQFGSSPQNQQQGRPQQGGQQFGAPQIGQPQQQFGSPQQGGQYGTPQQHNGQQQQQHYGAQSPQQYGGQQYGNQQGGRR